MVQVLSTTTVSLGMKWPLYMKSSMVEWGVPSQNGLRQRSTYYRVSILVYLAKKVVIRVRTSLIIA